MATVVERDVNKGGQPPIAQTQSDTRPQRLPLGPLKTIHGKWQHFASKKPGRPPGQEDRFWGVDRPGYRKDYIDESAGREDTHDQR